MEPTIPWYQSAIIRQQIVQLIVVVLGMAGVVTDIDWSATMEAVFGGIAAIVAVWTIVTRLFKATPPITEAAAVKTEAFKAKQGGFARPVMLLLLVCFSLPVALAIEGCTSTSGAYKAAASPDETAFVITEHYASLVREAANLRSRPTTPPEAVRAMQAADLVAAPLVDALRPLRDAYVATKSAQSEAELQLAVNQAVLAVADLVRQIQVARGAQ